MTVFQSIGLATRKLSILLAIILLVALSLFLFYYKYIPDNKNRLHHQAFVLLGQQANGIKQNLDDLTSYFSNKKKIEDRTLSPMSTTDTFYQEGSLKYEFKSFARKNVEAVPDSTKPKIYFDLDHQSEMTFQFDNTFDSVQFKLSFDQLFEKVLEQSKLNFFEYHFVVCSHHSEVDENQEADGDEDTSQKHSHDHEQPHILYQSSSLAASEQLQQDSIGKMLGAAQFSKLINLELNGSRFRGFMLPFQLRHNTLILVGLMPETEYRGRLQNIPFSTVSTIIIIFILILICLPYIKIFFMSKQEHFGIRDIALLGTTLFIGTAILLVVLQQILMVTGSQLRTRNNLYNLGDSINATFRRDITGSYLELRHLDSTLKEHVNSTWLENPRDTVKNKLLVRQVPGECGYFLPFPEQNAYLNYYLVQWTNASGQQVYKSRFDSATYTFSNVSHRKYFEDVNMHHLYKFKPTPGETTPAVDSFTIQPVYSMSTNAFEVNLAIPSSVPGIKMAALSAYMYSVMHAVLPSGYGFYVIDNKGIIQFQSEGTVTLQENLLEWINDNDDIANVVKNRLSRYISDQYINDKQYSVFVRPIDQLPYHLVVYHCNDHTTASILHVNAFELFSLFVLFSSILLFGAIAWATASRRSKLNNSIFQYEWLRPGNGKSKFFLVANFYLLLYAAVLFLYNGLIEQYSTLWFVGLVFPVFVVWTLYLLFRHRRELDHPLPVSINHLVASVIRPHNITPLIYLTLLDTVYFSIEPNLIPRVALLHFEITSLLLTYIPVFFSKIVSQLPDGASLKRILTNVPSKRLFLYNLFWFLCVVDISVIPGNCFFRYAQSKEIALQLKSHQLDMAANIEKRLSTFEWFNNILKKRDISESQGSYTLFRQGVYNDSCIKAPAALPNIPNKIVTDPYDKAIRAISWKYHSLDKTLLDRDTAYDNQWYRNDSGTLFTLIYNLSPESKPGDSVSTIGSLQVSCTLPGVFRYFMLRDIQSITIILASSILLLILFYHLIVNITDRLFHPWYFRGLRRRDMSDGNVIRQQIANNGLALFSNVEKTSKKTQIPEEAKYLYLKRVWQKEYDDNGGDDKKITSQEDAVLCNQHQFAPLYGKLWKSCSHEERHFLYDMSTDGFINYKKNQMVEQLLHKGLLIYDGDNLRIMSVSFRNFILDKTGTKEISKLKDQFSMLGTWSKLRTPVLVAITAVGIFLFITQQDLLQRVAALVPTLSAIFGLGTLILGTKGNTANAK